MIHIFFFKSVSILHLWFQVLRNTDRILDSIFEAKLKFYVILYTIDDLIIDYIIVSPYF